ncbi:MAG: branched-chain amino acid transport system substrate-binding protein [Gaiellales bacterium]|nr:branched-chain amino acid transport system substrate-binding protein [Gaiellales bacterium]
MNIRRNRIVLAVTAAALAAGAVACGGSSSSSGSSGSTKPLVIGISLSQSGDFSDPGHAALLGYQLWADSVNKRGGVLGRKVELKVVDDASSPNQVVTNYQTLISKDKVDLVFGPFSTLLTAPAARVASRYGYSFLEPAGGGPLVFEQKLNNVFFVQPAPIVNCGDALVNYLSTLPASQRPKTAAYPTLDDPFATPIVDRARPKLEALGIKTVFSQIYPAETADMTPVVAKMIAAKPDLIFGGTQSADAYSIVNDLVQQHYDPKFLFLSNGANSAAEFPGKVGANNTEGILSCTDWFPDIKTSGNPQFVSEYTAKYGGTKDTIDAGSAEAYAVGQLLEAVANKTGKVDNATIISTLHSGTWPTIEGNLSWDQYGQPTGSELMTEWLSGKLVPVWPQSEALAAPVIPKPAWGG